MERRKLRVIATLITSAFALTTSPTWAAPNPSTSGTSETPVADSPDAGSIKELVRKIEQSNITYPDRSRDLRSLKDYINNGDFNMADYKAKSILGKQANLSSQRTHGLPKELKSLMEQAEKEKLDYDGRYRDFRSLEDYIENGDFKMAAYKLKGIIKVQTNLRAAQKGPPANLKAKIDRIDQTQIAYEDRDADMKQLNKYLSKGDFDMAEWKAQDILKTQENLKKAKNGLPDHLRTLVDQVEQQKLDYEERPTDIKYMERYLKKGDFKMAEFKLKAILKKQENLKASLKGLPEPLHGQLATIDQEKLDYPDRRGDMKALTRYLKNGEYDMAEFRAKSIIEKQRNLKVGH